MRPQSPPCSIDRRSLNRLVPGQQEITNYFEFLNAEQKLLAENVALKELLDNYITSSRSNTANNSKSIQFLNDLISSAEENTGKHVNGYRYKVELKKFASYIFIMGSKNVYETLEKNLPGSLPSTTTIGRSLKKYSKPVKEGDFRFQELKKYLQDRSLPSKVWISEDGTRITGKIQYDSLNDQISGFVPPFNHRGIPIVGSFPAETAEQIRSYFLSSKIGNYAYVIMAQPLHEGVAPFCVAFFSSDNRFTGAQVISRWQWMTKQASEQGIKILGFSSDGDTRLLKAMKFKAFPIDPEVPLQWQSFFFQSLLQNEFYVQDTTHILTKLRTVFLNKLTTL